MIVSNSCHELGSVIHLFHYQLLFTRTQQLSVKITELLAFNNICQFQTCTRMKDPCHRYTADGAPFVASNELIVDPLLPLTDVSDPV